MNILFVGKFHKSSTNVLEQATFEKMGHKVIPMEIVDGLVYYSAKFDFVLISKGAGISTDFIRAYAPYCPVVLWYMDAMNNFDDELIEKIKACDIFFSSMRYIADQAGQYSKRCYYQPAGFYPPKNKPWPLPKEYDVSFIGNPYNDDRKLHCKETGAEIIRGYFGKGHAKMVSRTKINLGFTFHGQGASNRIYKVMAAGGFLLTQPWREMELDFTPDVELVTFDSLQDCKDKIAYYLEHEIQREVIAECGMEKVRKHFTMKHWASKIITEVKEWKRYHG